MLQGVLVESVPCPAPEELRPEYTKPKVLEGEVLRTLTLDRKGEFFQWNMPVDGKKISGSGELRQVGSGRHETPWTG